ncbi:MAG: CPBP family intramembrane metalloprotease [Eubacteriaceae bacterium]|nr:CPBP family intramembrane metalloprotease [Eubacteriaceae bacterium]
MWEKFSSFARERPIACAFLLTALFFALVSAGGLPLMANPNMGQRIGIPVFSMYQTAIAAFGIFLMKKAQVFDSSDFALKNTGKGLMLGWVDFLLMAVVIATGIQNRSAYFIKPEPLFLLAVILFPLSTGFLEEAVFRGLVLKVLLRQFGGTKKGIIQSFIISAALFAIVHSIHAVWQNPLDVASDVLFAAAGGMFLGAIYMRTKTLIAPILLHWLHNLSATIFIAFTSSEYQAPEAGLDDVLTLIALGVLPLVAAAFVLLRKAEPDWALAK